LGRTRKCRPLHPRHCFQFFLDSCFRLHLDQQRALARCLGPHRCPRFFDPLFRHLTPVEAKLNNQSPDAVFDTQMRIISAPGPVGFRARQSFGIFCPPSYRALRILYHSPLLHQTDCMAPSPTFWSSWLSVIRLRLKRKVNSSRWERACEHSKTISESISTLPNALACRKAT